MIMMMRTTIIIPRKGFETENEIMTDIETETGIEMFPTTDTALTRKDCILLPLSIPI